MHPTSAKQEETAMTTFQPTLTAVSADISAPKTAAAAATPAISAKTWIAVIGATLGAFLAVLNIQSGNTSHADIQRAIRGGIDHGSRVANSYLLGQVVGVPLKSCRPP